MSDGFFASGAMPTKSTRPRDKASSLAAVHDGHDHRICNALLLGLSSSDRQSVLSKLEFVRIPTHCVLNEMGAAIKFAYFINSGLGILNVMSDGKSVEVGLAGRDGFVGLPVIVGFLTSPTQAVMQIEGSASRVRANDIEGLLRRFPALEKSLQRYAQGMSLQATQVAACNRLHQVEERLARCC